MIGGNDVDITHSHLFLGYRPLILGIVVVESDAQSGALHFLSELALDFRSESGEWVAGLQIRKVNHVELDHHVVYFYEGIHGDHRFLNPLHQWVNRQREKLRKRNLSDADLSGNNYDQVRIAYSIPRTISVITVGDGDKINMFPTDLHGTAGDEFYISSLRIGGLANSQVENYKKIALSEVFAQQFRSVYSLGKNHMKDLRVRSEFETDELVSFKLGCPLPKGVIAYRELEQFRSFDCGIHRIHIYRVLHRENIGTSKSVLAHIHNYYGQWRADNKLESRFLIR